MQSPARFKDSLFAFVWRYLKLYPWIQLGFFIVALCWAIELTLSPYLLKHLIDLASGSQAGIGIESYLWPGALYISMTLWMNLNFRLFDAIQLRLYPDLKVRIGKDMFDYLLFHSYAFFQDNFSGTLTRKNFDMCGSVEKVIRIFNEWFYPRILALMIASFSMSVVVKPIFGWLLLIWTCLYIVVSYVGSKVLRASSTVLSSTRAKMSGTLTDSISNILLTILFSKGRYERERVKNSLDQLAYYDRRVQRQQLVLNFIQSIMVTVLVTAEIFLLVHYRLSGTINAGDFVFILTLSMFVSNSVWQIGTQMLEFSKAVGEARQAMSYLVIPHGVQDKSDASPIEIKHGNITFQNVYFRYDKQGLFEDVNVTIPAGQRVGLVGHSGGGKSSLLKLIMRLMDIERGQITVDNQDIQCVQQQSLRQQITIIPQETQLFHRSIMENIRFARPEASDEEVIWAAKQAYCHDFISQLPQGYQSTVGERGVKLSGGQKQRMAIARAFLKSAPILLVDEATSSLDSKTEKLIQAGFHKVMQGKTVVVVAHRLSTIKDLDRILVIDQGRIVEDGTHQDLIGESEIYKSLWEAQTGGFLGDH